MRNPLSRLLICLAVVAFTPLNSQAQTTSTQPPNRGEAPAPTPQQVQAALSHFENIPTASELVAMGPNTLAVLIALYENEQTPAYVRIRVLTVVRYFATPTTRRFLTRALNAAGQSDLHQREALFSLAAAFGANARGEIAPSLRSPYPVVREAAGRALLRTQDQEAARWVHDHLQTETHAATRRALIEALHRNP